MLKLINLFFIGIFIISCGGEVGVVFHNNSNTGSTTGTGNSGGTAVTPKPIVELTCLPGADCNVKTPTNVRTSTICLPGVECVPAEIKVDTGTKPGTSTGGSKDKTDGSTNKTDNSKDKKTKGCLPGQTSC